MSNITKVEKFDTVADFNRLPDAARHSEKMYADLVDRLYRRRYSQADNEAIINNYLDDSNNEKYKKEFFEMQAYRKECKAEAKQILEL